MKSYFQVARKYIPDEVTPVASRHYKYSRLINYPAHSVNGYASDYRFNAIRVFIKNDSHLRDHAQLNGFDIFFADPHGRLMPFELVYYGNGTGEWWVFPGDGQYNTIPEVVKPNLRYIGTNNWVTDLDYNDVSDATTLYMLYDDRTSEDHVEVTTDPTTKVWDGEAVIAHSSYLITNELNKPHHPYEEPTSSPESRPINSAQYSGHTSGFTAIYYPSSSYSYLWLVEGIGNGCAIQAVSSTNINHQIPIYQYTNGVPSTGGSLSSLVFCVGSCTHSNLVNSEYSEETILRYHNIEVTAYKPLGTTQWTIRFYTHSLFYGGGEFVPTKQCWQGGIVVPNLGGTVFGLVFGSTTMDNGYGTVLPATIVGLAHAEIDLESNMQSYSEDGVTTLWDDSAQLYDDAVYCRPFIYDTAALLEIRSDIPLSIHHDTELGTVEIQGRRMLQSFGSMVFNIENSRTIGNPVALYDSPRGFIASMLCNKIRTYQGLTGGCN